MTKLALVWSAERAGREIDAIWEKRQAVERKRADYDDTLRAKLIEAKANYGGSFKEFVEKHTHISLTTAKRTLRIADGRGEEVRQQERERQQRHRGRDNPPVTPSPPITAAEGVKLATSQGVTMTEPQVAECLRLAAPKAEFEKHIEDTVAAEVASLVPEPVGQFPVIDFTFVGNRLSDVDRLFPGVELYDSNRTFQFDTDGIDLELYDTLERVAEKVRIIAQSLRDVPVIEEARNKRARAEHERWQAERKAEAEPPKPSASLASRGKSITARKPASDTTPKHWPKRKTTGTMRTTKGNSIKPPSMKPTSPARMVKSATATRKRNFSSDGEKSITRFGRVTWKPSRIIPP